MQTILITAFIIWLIQAFYVLVIKEKQEAKRRAKKVELTKAELKRLYQKNTFSN